MLAVWQAAPLARHTSIAGGIMAANRALSAAGHLLDQRADRPPHAFALDLV